MDLLVGKDAINTLCCEQNPENRFLSNLSLNHFE